MKPTEQLGHPKKSIASGSRRNVFLRQRNVLFGIGAKTSDSKHFSQHTIGHSSGLYVWVGAKMGNNTRG